MKEAATTEEIGRRTSSSPGSPLLIFSGEVVPALPSGILNGEPFETLTYREATRVVMTWVQIHWKPEQLGRKLFDPRNPMDHLAQELEVTEDDLRAYLAKNKVTVEGGLPRGFQL